MKNFTNRALAAAFAVSLILGSGSVAFADRGGNGHGNGQAKTHAKASTHAKPWTAATARPAHADIDNDNDNDNDNDRNKNKGSKARGNSATAHSCINPAGNTRGWCKSHAGGDYITGTVTAINGNTATVALSNGQIVTVNSNGLTVGQRVTLRGSYQNGTFVANGQPYSNYGGPYSSASVRGLIISVSGNSLQIVQGLSMITIDATNAISRGAINGTLIPGRTITASGNWNGSTFVATSIQ